VLWLSILPRQFLHLTRTQYWSDPRFVNAMYLPQRAIVKCIWCDTAMPCVLLSLYTRNQDTIHETRIFTGTVPRQTNASSHSSKRWLKCRLYDWSDAFYLRVRQKMAPTFFCNLRVELSLSSVSIARVHGRRRRLDVGTQVRKACVPILPDLAVCKSIRAVFCFMACASPWRAGKQATAHPANS
jgi:hypothetical protein